MMLARRSRLFQYRTPRQRTSLGLSIHNGTGLAGFKTVSSTRDQATVAESGPHPNDSFLLYSNYIDEMYDHWRKSPESVHVSCQIYFRNMEQGLIPVHLAFQPPPGLISSLGDSKTRQFDRAVDSTTGDQLVQKTLRLYELVEAYRIHGHAKAHIDPLAMRGLCDGMGTGVSAELELHNHSLTEADLDAEFALGPQILPRLYENGTRTMKLKDILAIYERAYCGAYRVEFRHIHEREKRSWIQDRIELENPIDYSKAEKKQILDRLIWSSNFEQFLATKYPNEKRYGLEGGESFAAGIKALVDASVEHGVDNIVIGSQHRGRLSLLTNLVRKPIEEIFQEFSLGGQPSHPKESGDVKTHLGMTYERTCPSGKKVKISLLPNPSHLEADDPVAAGKTKALQHLTGDEDYSKTMCLTFHGDAAVAGQGVVYETLTLSRPPAFNVGGTIHVIVNNQIGFTTDPVLASEKC